MSDNNDRVTPGQLNNSKSDNKNDSLKNNDGDEKKSKGDKNDSSKKSKGDKGDSKKSKGDKENKLADGAKSVGKKVAMNAAASVGTTIAADSLIKSAIMMIKLKLQMVVQAIQTAVQAALGPILAIIMTISAIFTAIVTTVTDAFSTAEKDGQYIECTAYVNKSMIGNSHSSVDINKLKRQTAKRIYSTYFYYGLRPEQIFAILGNWEHESQLDPTQVENIFNEPYSIKGMKQRAITADFVVKDWDPIYARTKPLIERSGIGLGQWTNDRNKELVEYAKLYGAKYLSKTLKSNTKEIESMWYDLTVQLAYSIDKESVGDNKASWFDAWKDVGKDKWDGDKKVDITMSGKCKWDTATTKDGVFDDTVITLHPVGENYNEETIGSEQEDTYYRDEERNKAKDKANEVMNNKWDAIISAHVPIPYTDENGVVHDGVEEANNSAKSEYLKKWKQEYRYWLYYYTVERYTEQFKDEWEVCTDDSLQSRIDSALVYYEEWWKEANKYGSRGEVLFEGEPNYYVGADDRTDRGDYFFYVEEGYASGIIDVLDKTADRNYSLKKIYKYDEDMGTCNRVLVEDRVDIAICAALIAWPTIDQSRNNNGTEMYQWVYENVIPEDFESGTSSTYMSCDRTVCTAVRWSGYDDNYPNGATLQQIQYLVTSPRWVELDWGGDRNQLQPGDILIRKDSVAPDATAEVGNAEHHTLVYIGETIAKNYADTTLGSVLDDSCIVHGSFDSRSPGIGKWSNKYSTYHAFRCIYPMNEGESKYRGVGKPKLNP